MNQRILLVLALLLIAIFSCHTDTKEPIEDIPMISPMERLPKNEAGDIVRKAIEFAGGWETWVQKKNFSFYKDITHLDSAGQVERNQRQFHQYQIHPQFKARMSWEDQGNQYVIINNGEEAKKYENGKEMTDDNSKNQAWNSSYGSNYVVSMPFKLTDPGVILTYEGIDSSTLGRRVHSLKVEYEKGAGSTGGMHVWWYYFEEDNYDLAANFLDYGTGYSLTTYESFQEVGELRIHKERFSHIADAEKRIVQKRTVYQNGEMKFDEVFEKDLFELNWI